MNEDIEYIVDTIFDYVNDNDDGATTMESTIKSFYKAGEKVLLIEHILDYLEESDVLQIKRKNPVLLEKLLFTADQYKIDSAYTKVLRKTLGL